MKPEVTRIVRNQSSRGGVKPRIIVLHTTEGHERSGLSDLEGLGAWFDNPAAQASSHVANDAEGNDARYVPDANKAWTQAGFNPVSLSIEQIGFASESKEDWLNQKKQLANTAAWIRYWAKKYDIPIQRGKVSGSSVYSPGVVFHSDLGSYGGGHHDPGAGYPLDLVLKIAKGERERLKRRERKLSRRIDEMRDRVAEVRDRIKSTIKRRRDIREELADTFS